MNMLQRVEVTFFLIFKSRQIRSFIWIGLLLVVTACTSIGEKPRERISGLVGEIPFDETQDDSTFTICNAEDRIIQYYAFGEKTYGEEKIALERLMEKHYDTTNITDQSGLIRIRFIVNCDGVAGRFRVLSMDETYAPFTFDASITDQLLELVKSHSKWKTFESDNGRKFDYYQYLIFKIESGRVIEILP